MYNYIISATVACSVSGNNNQNLKMSLTILKENDTMSEVSVCTALANDPMSSSPINDENCRLTGNGEVDTPFSVTLTFDVTLLSYPCGIAVVITSCVDDIFFFIMQTFAVFEIHFLVVVFFFEQK
jgi:hypothetical protein